MRKIIHLDMDCFYAAVEMRERPELAGQPIAVGGGSRRGVVTTCNYEARKFGVHSAMPGFQAREKCPSLVFLPVRFDLYRAESAKIRQILLSYTPLVEPLSLDEAYLDVTGLDRFAWDIAKEIRNRIFDETRLTASAGIAPNKMLAKIASDWCKPNGQFASHTFNGIGLPSADLVPTSYLPELIASHVYSEVLEQPGSEPLIRELEDASGDDDWQQKFGEMPLIKFVEELKAMDPLQANLLLVAIEYFWIWRKNMPLAAVRLEDFFNIQDRPRS